ncbi:MAG: TauD/TfdA family dioxygenase [Cryobacterium sp.]|nr:TauD/TfdA family dioxygenase [Oligoflexia bacterium]
MKTKITRGDSFGVFVEPTHPEQSIHDLEIGFLRELVWQERLVVLRGFQSFQGGEELSSYCERWGVISIWPFGKILELVEQPHPEDHIFDNNAVPLHWDGMYRPQVPEFQIFHCVSAPLSGQRGRTTFSNTVSALENAPARTRALWEKVTGSYERKMEFYQSKTISPIVDTHPFRGFPVIRYNEPPREEFEKFLNPPALDFTGGSPDEIAECHRSLRETLYAPENFYAHEWQTGDLVIADNFSLLHGREGFNTKAPRHLRRVHVLSQVPLDNPRLVSHQ